MRDALAQGVIERFGADPNCFFLTVDVGFNSLEPVRAAFGSRFINVGVAEQNLIGVAAGLAREGLRVFCYSIAPFLYARPFEQIRNDLGFTGLPVCLVGNGGGYAYGVMGPSHHALEDCAVMQAVGIRTLVPAFDRDVPHLIADLSGPTYLRLGHDECPSDFTPAPYSPWRKLLEGEAGVMVALGPLGGIALQAFAKVPAKLRPAVWAVTELAPSLIPDAFWREIEDRRVWVCEEHVALGGLGMMLAHAILSRGARPSAFVHRTAVGYPRGRYGSQSYHRAQCGLDLAGLKAEFGLP